ncbi:MAG: hypothetical protein ACI857_001538 [Arenicella sp.]|jgi:hypothetical protein
MKTLLTSLGLLLTLYSFGQEYLLKNEKAIYSFETVSGKSLMIARDSSDSYLVYRFGTSSNIELEYPKNKRNSWQKFEYSYWFRGGGIENAGLDINFLYFDIGHYRYIVYDTYSAESEKNECGIKVINQNTEKETDILGLINTTSGSLLAGFRWNDLISEGDVLYF